MLDKIDLRLTRAGVVTGKVVDEFGDPVTDVFVTAMRYQYVQGSRRLMQTGRGAQTNDIGEYRIYGLSPGQYYVSATLRNFGGMNADTERSLGIRADVLSRHRQRRGSAAADDRAGRRR